MMTPAPLCMAHVALALSSETRLRMVEALAETSMTITELAATAGVHQTTASYHCHQLEGAGLVSVQADGNRRYVSLRARELHFQLGANAKR